MDKKSKGKSSTSRAATNSVQSLSFTVLRSCTSRQRVPINSQKIIKQMDWVPVVLITFKVLVFGTCMFFAIKWHYDQDKKEKKREQEANSATNRP